ncbi:MAG: type II toxin-antitoxin system HicA family toxin [Candidatus Kuenenbacteria bacterium]
MSKLSPISVKKLAKILKKLGFQCIRQKGSHAFYEHQDGRTTMLAIHYGEDISRGLLHKIIAEDIQITVDEFNRLK